MGVGLMSLRELEAQMNAGSPMQLVDLRPWEDYRAGHLEGAVSLPYEELPARMGELGTWPPVVFICARGGVSLQAARMAAARGIPAYSVANGLTYYRGCHMTRNELTR